MAGIEAATLSGAGHLLNFTGTDTIPAIDFLEEYYQANSDTELIGGSVAATEHSVMCMGTTRGEYDTFKRLITAVYPKGIVSIVSDTWDLWKVLTDYLPRLKDTILSREGKVVIRPDSGDPVEYYLWNTTWQKRQ
jgi:nicotinamide phosphoribosyltransferase